jgi:hypothetical protein
VKFFQAPSHQDGQDVISSRLQVAQAFSLMMLRAYDALVSYGVNYREGTAYQDMTLLEQAEKSHLARATQLYVEWIGRVEKDIQAMIRRKGFHLT